MLRLFLITLLLFVGHLPANAQIIAIKAGKLVDPSTKTVRTNQIIFIKDGKINTVTKNKKIPADVKVIDLSTSVVLPGLFDTHTHLCMNLDHASDRWKIKHTLLEQANTDRAISGVVNARAMLHAGFTTVRDLGNEGHYACASVRRAIEDGKVQGPTLINAGRMITPYGGQFYLHHDSRDVAEPEYFIADSRDEMRKAIRENIHFGAKVIKIAVDDQPYIYSVDDIKFMKTEAEKAGLKLAAHVWGEQGAHNAIEAGVASVEHLNGVSDKDLLLAKQNNVVAVFTPFPRWILEKAWWAQPHGADAEYHTEIDRLRSAYKIGVPIAFGSDAMFVIEGYNRGTLAMSWIDSYVDAGMSAPDILRSMTVIAARLLGVDNERGQIKPGLAADIIAVRDNPLQNIMALKQVNFVMKNGIVVKNH